MKVICYQLEPQLEHSVEMLALLFSELELVTDNIPLHSRRNQLNWRPEHEENVDLGIRE